ncbi:hypothetical protein SADUNF_Sadunf18G0026500 [Salix dunnii]|uniref:Pentatricopeptide repeat-containing protein n=1 Tax=Salix dunnii TaxID=1413687 RepID=A0A835MDF6_9ROSI|nr:hypothetical protein SADUNF_Sadunf18G0026500 [Salix dunnii]
MGGVELNLVIQHGVPLSLLSTDSFCSVRRILPISWSKLYFLIDIYIIGAFEFCMELNLQRAFELVDEMKREGIKSNATVCNLVIDALAEAGRDDGELFICARQAPLSPPTILIAFVEFEDMLGGGIAPRYRTFHRLNDEFRKHGMIELARMLSNLMSCVLVSRN